MPMAIFDDVDDDIDALTLGRRIRQLRTDKGMTLDQLAAAIGRAPSQLSMIENGHREPKLSLLRALAAALEVSFDDLWETEPLSERSQRSEERRVGKEWRSGRGVWRERG